MKKIKCWLQGVSAGICIGFGTVTYLRCENKLLGAFLFAFGLFLVCSYGLKLCTGMAGYLINKNIDTSGFVLAAVGNVVGMSIMYCLSTLWRSELRVIGEHILEEKLLLMPYQTFISAMFCGMLMFVAVNGYKMAEDISMKLLSIFVAVPIFVICGFDHCVVSVYYALCATTYEQGVLSLMFVCVVMVGNFIGSIVANLLLSKLSCWIIRANR